MRLIIAWERALTGPLKRATNVQFLFTDHRLDPERRELWRGSEQVALEPQVFDLLLYLIRNRDRVVSKDDLIAAVWGGRVVSDSTLTSRINAARKAVGDSGEEQRLIRTIVRKGVRFVVAVAESSAPTQPAAVAEPPPSPLQQQIHFCTASDGARIAYASAGQGPPLVKAANWLNHLEYDWQSPVWSHLLHAFAREYQLVRYDERGNGLSDWEVEDISFEAFVRDLESVVDAAKLPRFALLGISQGCAVCVAYAVRHPERVSHLVLYGGYARGRCMRGSTEEIEQANALATLMRQGWGRENPAFRRVFTSLFIPGGTTEQVKWFDDLQRVTSSPENAIRIREAMNAIDVTDLLPRVTVPTLVMHCRSDAVVPFEEGRRLAAGIQGARFVPLEGQNHTVLETDPGWQRFHDEICDFLKS
jgi:pimeloyl-ACP methyl ester carboxylesterase/DNA-binding winged helix-turn-helix (wHTH) protein